MRKLILFKANKGEIEKYRQKTETQIGKSFYRIANVDSVPSLINTIAEHYDSSGKPAPVIGHRLTETVPEHRDSFPATISKGVPVFWHSFRQSVSNHRSRLATRVVVFGNGVDQRGY